MSIAGDLLTAATPVRLFCRRGVWYLELIRFVSVDRNVFQPRAQRLEGSDAILQHLKRGEHAGLAGSVNQLMRGFKSDEEPSLELVEGEWVPSKPHRDSVRPGAPTHGPQVTDEVAELRAELLILRASHERLRERVARVESLIHATDGLRNGLSVRPGGQISAKMAESVRASFPNASPAIRIEEATSDAPAAIPSAAATNEAAANEAAASIRGAGVATPARMKLPPVAAINTCLHALLGDRISVREKKPVTFAPADDDAYWVSPLIDDDGVEAGVIVSDLAATATLGGILMMLPDDEIKDQRNSAPSEDSIAAMSEVANNLSATINQLPDAPRVRVKPIQLVTPGLLDWAKSARHRLELEIAGGLGRLFLFSR